MKIFTTYQISKMLNVDITTVIDWVNKGMLKAYKTPGGHRRVQIDDLVDFLKKYKMPVPDVITRVKPEAILKKVLIVDDEKGILDFISRAIKKFFKNVEIETAADGFAAGRKISEFKPDLLILDIRLPGIDGFKVLEQLKKEKMKIVVITAYHSEETKEKVFKAGADAYLIKPFDIEELIRKIGEILD
ncbi:MAG: response regulator [Elusimicrobia bacterium]|nr:response regulator [Elusimicrobiota bacterium]